MSGESDSDSLSEMELDVSVDVDTVTPPSIHFPVFVWDRDGLVGVVLHEVVSLEVSVQVRLLLLSPTEEESLPVELSEATTLYDFIDKLRVFVTLCVAERVPDGRKNVAVAVSDAVLVHVISFVSDGLNRGVTERETSLVPFEGLAVVLLVGILANVAVTYSTTVKVDVAEGKERDRTGESESREWLME